MVQLLGAVVPPGVVTAEEVLPAPYRPSPEERSELFPQERAYIHGSSALRRAQFEAARRCAGTALKAFGVTRPPMMPGPGGAPVFPTGFRGSMTHKGCYVAAAVAPDFVWAGVGVDAELDEPLPQGVLEAVTGPGDLEHVYALQEQREGPHWDRILFSAKESAFKLYFTTAGVALAFATIRVRFDASSNAIAVMAPGAPLVAVDKPQTIVRGRWSSGDGLIVTAVTAPAAESYSGAESRPPAGL